MSALAQTLTSTDLLPVPVSVSKFLSFINHSSYVHCELVTGPPHVQPTGIKAALEQLGVLFWSRMNQSFGKECQTVAKNIIIFLNNAASLFLKFFLSLFSLPRHNPARSSCSSLLFLFNHITDWDINLRFATAAPALEQQRVRYSEA